MRGAITGASRLADAAIAALWVAVCALTPEFIWRGWPLVLHHANRSSIIAALLVGLILACCVEPAIKRLHHAAHRSSHAHEEPTSLLFTLGVGVAFAVASYVIHDAITNFLAQHAEDATTRQSGLSEGLRLAFSWAIVPFCVSLAWLAWPQRLLRYPLAALALASPAIAAHIFGWSLQDWLTTQLPATAILLLGYRQWGRGPAPKFFRRCARFMLWFCPLWLILALPVYSHPEFGIDIRFYLGWLIGLSLAPVPKS